MSCLQACVQVTIMIVASGSCVDFLLKLDPGCRALQVGQPSVKGKHKRATLHMAAEILAMS